MFAKEQGAPEGDDIRHWDITFWSERLREAKFDINEVGGQTTHICTGSCSFVAARNDDSGHGYQSPAVPLACTSS